jgi:hypothetical protein
MRVQYENLQNEFDSMSGSEISDSANLASLLDGIRNNIPFIARLRGEDGFQLFLGIGSDLGFVEYMCVDGSLPYLAALSAKPQVKAGHVEFLTANTPTPIPARFILSFDEMKQIALHFLKTGERSDAVIWESI